MTEPLRFGVVGYGVIGDWHVESIKACDDAVFVAAADCIKERADACCQKHGGTSYDNLEEMLDKEEPDAICVCTPSGLHGDHAIAAMERGVHVLVEKPMDINLKKCRQMIDTAREHNAKMAVVCQYRFKQHVQELRRVVNAGELGRLILGDAYIKWYRTQKYYDSGDWRGTYALDGGGCLMNQGIHYIDLLQWVMGDVDTITAHAETLAHQIEVEDIALALLRFKNGAVGLIEGSTATYPGFPERLEIHGVEGSVTITQGQVTYWNTKEGGNRKLEEKTAQTAAADPKALGLAGHMAHVRDLAEAIREDRDPFIPGESAYKPVEIILGVYESARRGEPVQLPLEI